MDIQVTRDVLAAMERAAAQLAPEEACGILLGEGDCITAFTLATNVHPAPQTHFEIDPQALIDAHRAARNKGAQVLGYFHSHPGGNASPSRTDANMAAGDGAIWAIHGADHGAGKQAGAITFWRSGSNGFVPLSYRLGGV